MRITTLPFLTTGGEEVKHVNSVKEVKDVKVIV